MTTLALVVAFAGGYLVGTIPTAYLLVRKAQGVDLRHQGTSNIGAMNTYEVTGSRNLGIAVLLLDAAKGFLAWFIGLIAFVLFLPDLTLLVTCGAAIVGAIAGHNYNIWLSLSSGRIEGGKGLATAAGGLVLTMPHVLVVWFIFFVIGWWGFGVWRERREIIPGNVLATVVTPLAAFLLYSESSAYIVLLMALLILPKHFRQMRALLVARDKNSPQRSTTG